MLALVCSNTQRASASVPLPHARPYEPPYHSRQLAQPIDANARGTRPCRHGCSVGPPGAAAATTGQHLRSSPLFRSSQPCVSLTAACEDGHHDPLPTAHNATCAVEQQHRRLSRRRAAGFATCHVASLHSTEIEWPSPCVEHCCFNMHQPLRDCLAAPAAQSPPPLPGPPPRAPLASGAPYTRVALLSPVPLSHIKLPPTARPPDGSQLLPQACLITCARQGPPLSSLPRKA